MPATTTPTGSLFEKRPNAANGLERRFQQSCPAAPAAAAVQRAEGGGGGATQCDFQIPIPDNFSD